MKLTKKQIEAIIAHTKPELKGKAKTIIEILGWYQKPETNWRYWAGWTSEGDLVVTVYDEIK